VKLGPARNFHSTPEAGVFLVRHRWTRVPGITTSQPENSGPPSNQNLVWLH
ncbi:unnamed protein product, partial [Choristocarpus tenellus]